MGGRGKPWRRERGRRVRCVLASRGVDAGQQVRTLIAVLGVSMMAVQLNRSSVSCPSGPHPYILVIRSRSALPITETELRLMAAAAMMGLRRIPKAG